MNTVVVIQARTNSSRLPAKVLLPIQGLPVVVLAAKRAANTGNEILVVTSQEASDDELCSVLSGYEIPFFRGSLNNTLDRFVSALAGYSDQTIVVRLTADNIIPDGKLIDQLKDDFLTRQLDYLVCNGEESGLPYGVSVELTKLEHLRDAARQATAPDDLEHVTPYVRRKFGETYFREYRQLMMGNYRCTIDSLDDYLAMVRLFKDVAEPENEWFDHLLSKIKNTFETPYAQKPANKMVLGCAQLGFEYGINNTIGQPGLREAEDIVKKAISNGISCLDTARAYGDSEAVLGHILDISWRSRVELITKLSPLTECNENTAAQDVKAYVKESVFESCFHLHVNQLDGVLMHRASHFAEWGGAVWMTLLEFKQCNIIKKLGVSIQSPQELDLALQHEQVELIQLPFNIFDYRWQNSIERVRAVKARRNLVIHSRSSLLQGLLLTDNKNSWHKAHHANPDDVINWLNSRVKKYNRKSVLDLCLAYVRSQDWIDAVVVGLETIEQLKENLQLFDSPDLSVQQMIEIDSSKPKLSAETLNPANWS